MTSKKGGDMSHAHGSPYAASTGEAGAVRALRGIIQEREES